MLNSFPARRPLTALTQTTLGALIINTLAYASELIKLGLDREVTTVVGVLAITSILVALGWRWTPALGALIAGGLLFANPFLQFNLSQPLTSSFFLAALVQVISALFVLVAGIGATIQNYRKTY